MGKDESATLATLKAHRRELIDPKITEYGGRIVKTTGDGLLLEFPSVVDAVRCAVDVQRGMAQRNADVPADRAIAFRIGINVGDIIIDGDDIFGDGVNVAARLETLAEPGGICVSRVVRDQVLDKLSFAFGDLGPQEVKNIVRPVEVFRVSRGARSRRALGSSVARYRAASSRCEPSASDLGGAVDAARDRARRRRMDGEPAIHSPDDDRAVLDLGPSHDLRHASRRRPGGTRTRSASQGTMTDSVTTAQEARTRWAQVVPRRSVEEALARHTGTRDLGAALNVHFLLRGNVSRASAGYTGELFVIDAATERILDKRTLSIASTTLALRYTPAIDNALGWLTYQALRLEVQRARDKPLEELDVRDLAFRAYVDWGSNPEQDPKAAYTSATQLLNRALALSPDDLALYLTRRRISATASTAGRETSPSSRRSERQHSIGISGAIPTLLPV